MELVTFSYTEQSIRFNNGGKEVVLQGIRDNISLKMVYGKQFKMEDSKAHPEVQPLLNNYLSIFETPMKLPPNRSPNHKIAIKKEQKLSNKMHTDIYTCRE